MSDSLGPHGLCSLPGPSVHGIFQARVLEWVAISFSRGSSRPRYWTWVSCTAGRCFTIWATRDIACKIQGLPEIVADQCLDCSLCPLFLPKISSWKEDLLLFSCSVVSDSATPWTAAQPGLPALHYFPEHAQTHVHQVGDAIQPSHPLSSPSPPAFNLSQNQGL